VVFNATALVLERLGGTRISLLYVGQSGQPYSYVYLDDLNADGYPGAGQVLDLSNDLVYVPDSFGLFPGGGVSALLFEQLLLQEPCLQAARLKVLSRNACRAPWSHQLDLRIAQDFRAGSARLKVVVDVLNVLNLINGDWGHVQTVNPVVELLRADTRLTPGDPFGIPEPDDPLAARYGGPVGVGESGGVRALRPFAPRIGPSQWQAQLGFRVTFGGVG
jgi:hypothetical protein